MTGSSDDAYLVEHVRELLATDPHIGVIDVDVGLSRDEVVLRGDAVTPERRQAITEAVTRLCPDRHVRNLMTIMATLDDPQAEELR